MVREGETVLGLFEEEFYRARIVSSHLDDKRQEVIEVSF